MESARREPERPTVVAGPLRLASFVSSLSLRVSAAICEELTSTEMSATQLRIYSVTGLFQSEKCAVLSVEEGWKPARFDQCRRHSGVPNG
jgi:hypothetical protein